MFVQISKNCYVNLYNANFIQLKENEKVIDGEKEKIVDFVLIVFSKDDTLRIDFESKKSLNKFKKILLKLNKE